MKIHIITITILVLSSMFININSSSAMTAETSDKDIIIDGYYDDWSDKPYSWEYIWDNPWRIENYWNGACLITREFYDENGNPYNLEIRHKMSLYSDGKFVYVHIKVSSDYRTGFNGENYQFFIDGGAASFRITQTGGYSLCGNLEKMKKGIHVVEVRHGNGSVSNTVVKNAKACFTKKKNNLNNELEFKIPLSAMSRQNPCIKLQSFKTIEFYTPNLMYRCIGCSGVSTEPFIGIIFCLVFVLAGLGYRSKKSSISIRMQHERDRILVL